MIFIISGATSFIGLELCSYLIENDHVVYAVCREGNAKQTMLPRHDNLHIVYASMSDYGLLHNIISEADVFVNLAWDGTGHDGRNMADVQKYNIINTTAAMHAANRMGCRVFVESGSQAEYGTMTTPQREDCQCRPFSEYGKAKLRMKEEGFVLAEQLGMKYVHLRIFSLFGENDHPWTLVMSSLKKMLCNEPVDLSPCTQNWNFLYIKDAVKQIYLLCQYALKNPNYKAEVFNVASKDTRVLKDFVKEMHHLSKSQSELKFGAIIPANEVSLDPDVSKMEAATGFISQYAFKDIINNIISKYKQQYI